MLNAEHKCSKIKPGRIPFSPESSKWIKRAQTYCSILRFHAGKIRNKGNLKRAARRCGIKNCLGISLVEVRVRLKVCKDKCNYFRKNGQKYRTRHLKNRLQIAKDKGDEEAESMLLDNGHRNARTCHNKLAHCAEARQRSLASLDA